MNSKWFYPAIFHMEEGKYWVSFPDIPECLTEGSNMEHAYEMAVDALGLCIADRISQKEKLPTPSLPHDLYVETDSFAVIVEIDMDAYHRRNHSRSVKKTLTIPEWLNEEAIAREINFSQILKEALIARIQSEYGSLPE